MTPLAFQCFVQDLAATNLGMSGTLECKRAATQVVKSLGLQADLTTRAVVLAAADSPLGNSLRDLIQLNEDDPALKALVEELLRGEGTGEAMLCTDNTQFDKVLTADLSPIQHLVCCLLHASRLNAVLGNIAGTLCRYQQVCTGLQILVFETSASATFSRFCC